MVPAREQQRGGSEGYHRDSSYGMTVAAVDQEEELVRVRFSDGTVRQVALLVGADGIRSSVLGLLGLAASLDYHGQMVWRALVPRPRWATGVHQFAGEVNTAGLIPISAASTTEDD